MQNRDAEGAAGDVTRLPSTPATPTPSASGWLTSSDAISHGRFAPGTVLANRYRIVGMLGKGGMGEVYRADDLKLGQAVALKFLPPELARDPVRLAQFHGEVRLARQISHPNVCRVYDVDEVDGLPFLSMEYVDGENLASLLRQIGRLPEERALELARQLCAGVAAAHDRGVLHRDLKPANVMIDARGNVRVMDFGLAIAAGSAADLHAGTPAYMAPEQLAGREVSVRSDIYALGLVLFEMFTGRRTFDASTLGELLRLHESGDITTPTTIVPSLDPAIERAILRCLEREPERRPPSALAVAAALPGGDPLAAALAAGETPSPAMVAAAGHELALPLPVALGSLAAIALLLVTLPFVFDRVLLLRAIPTPKAVEALVDRAQTIRANLGYTEAPRDEAHGFVVDNDYLEYISTTDSSPGRWARLRAGRPPALMFWYRSSPRELAISGPGFGPSIADPPLSVSDMTSIATDGQGRLIRFDAVVPQREAEAGSASTVDWAPLFTAAGLPMASFTPSQSTWTPRTFADARAAWEGALPEDPATRIRIEAAAYRGRPVFFQIIGPWSRAGRMELRPENGVDVAVTVVLTLVLFGLLAGAAVIARRHVRRGRGDRSGAVRVALFIVAVSVTSWAMGAHHLADISAEMDAFFLHVAIGLLVGGIVWLCYLALEPLVRKWQPRALVGWTRLLTGAMHDPHVGRDVLAGVAAGALLALIRAPRGVMRTLAGGVASAPLDTSFAPLIGVRETIAWTIAIVPNAVVNAMFLVFVFALLRMVLRRTSMVIAVLTLLMLVITSLQLFSEPGRWMEFLLVIAGVAVVLTVIVRFGLLATTVMFVMFTIFERMPLTADPAAPYFATSTWILAAVMALAMFAAHAARAGQPLFAIADD